MKFHLLFFDWKEFLVHTQAQAPKHSQFLMDCRWRHHASIFAIAKIELDFVSG
jgi:hypothetical protein